MADTSSTDCVFNQIGRFHFRIRFFLDEFFTRLSLQVSSRDNPGHFFINGTPLDADGLLTSLNTCYNVKYEPSEDFLVSNNLVNQILYIKLDPILVQVIDVGF